MFYLTACTPSMRDMYAALLFGFRGLDNRLGEFGRDSGVLRK